MLKYYRFEVIKILIKPNCLCKNYNYSMNLLLKLYICAGKTFQITN